MLWEMFNVNFVIWNSKKVKFSKQILQYKTNLEKYYNQSKVELVWKLEKNTRKTVAKNFGVSRQNATVLNVCFGIIPKTNE